MSLYSGVTVGGRSLNLVLYIPVYETCLRTGFLIPVEGRRDRWAG
jgi:hypothetical protein